MKSFPKRRLALRPESACTLPVPPMTAYEFLSTSHTLPNKAAMDTVTPHSESAITIFPNRTPPHFSCNATQVTATVEFPALECTPNLIDHFFSVTFNVPAITPLPPTPPLPKHPEDTARSYQPSIFAARCTIELQPSTGP
jgi:hypothetical protein